MLNELCKIRNRKTGRVASWDITGKNGDCWGIDPGETKVLADIKGPAVITHIWMTQPDQYRECLIKITWDNARSPSVLVPLGDFFCLGHGMVNSFESALFTSSAHINNIFESGCALNCYVPMPFRERAVIELVNQGKKRHAQFFYIDYETLEEAPGPDTGYFHAEFRRTNPFGGWGHEIQVNSPQSNIANTGKTAWENNYVILETKGRGHYIGCNISVSNFKGQWWGEGDDMIWVDGYKWPPDLHGTGSEDYLNQAWGMQPNAFQRNGSSIWEGHNIKGKYHQEGGYQTSYVFHLENPVRFQKEIKVTMEHGHGNHLANEMSSVAYWYADKPIKVITPPPVAQRMAVLKNNKGEWLFDVKNQCPGKKVPLTAEMKRLKKEWAKLKAAPKKKTKKKKSDETPTV
jgi:hypothetical protein